MWCSRFLGEPAVPEREGGGGARGQADVEAEQTARPAAATGQRGAGGEAGAEGEAAPAGGGGRGGGAPAASMNAGLNHVVWNLSYPGPSTFPGMILWGASTAGPAALPGSYEVRLTVDGQESTQPLRIRTTKPT